MIEGKRKKQEKRRKWKAEEQRRTKSVAYSEDIPYITHTYTHTHSRIHIHKLMCVCVYLKNKLQCPYQQLICTNQLPGMCLICKLVCLVVLRHLTLSLVNIFEYSQSDGYAITPKMCIYTHNVLLYLRLHCL